MTILNLNSFKWRRDPQGYFVTGTSKIICRKGRTLRPYFPANTNGLHRYLASEVRDESSALDFVTQYGYLEVINPQATQTVDDIIRCAKRMRTLLNRFKSSAENQRYFNKKSLELRQKNFSDRNLEASMFNFEKPILFAQINKDENDSSLLRFDFNPVNLMSWLFLKAGEEITGVLRVLNCKGCGKEIEIYNRDGNAERQQYCRDITSGKSQAKCRKMYSRKLKKE